jgi:hypothetical protein
MKISQLLTTLILLGAASATLAGDLRTYRWTDENGVTHYGDRVPPEYADKDLSILNDQGVTVAKITGKQSEEELAAQEQRRAEREALAKEREEALLRDRVLLSTYLTVEEIEALRDRRVELVDGQMRVIQIYLDNLREKLLKLEHEAKRYSPYSDDPNAKPIDEKLARELSDTLDSIMLYEQNLAKSIAEQEELIAKFEADITRFKELRTANNN